MSYRQKIGQIAMPVVGEQLLQMSMGAVDNYFLAYLGTVALSSASVANGFITIYQSIFVALGAAISSYVSSKNKSVNRAVLLSEVLQMTIVVGLCFGVLSVIFSSQLLECLGTDTDVTRLGSDYLRIVGGSILLMGLMTSLGAFLRSEGHYRFPMRVTCLASLINIILSASSIYVWKFGLAGVAYSTVLSRFIAVVFLFKRVELPFHKVVARIAWSSQLVNIALPAVLERLMMRGGDLVMVMLLTAFGTKAIAGNAIGETLTQFNYMFGFAVSTAVVILVAQLKSSKKAKKILLKESYGFMLVSMIAIGIVIFLGRDRLIGLFTPELVVGQVASLTIIFSLIGLPVTAATLTLTAYSQGLGQSHWSFHATTFGMWVIRLGMGYFLAIYCGFGLWILYVTTILDNAFRSIYLYCKIKSGL